MLSTNSSKELDRLKIIDYANNGRITHFLTLPINHVQKHYHLYASHNLLMVNNRKYLATMLQ